MAVSAWNMCTCNFAMARTEIQEVKAAGARLGRRRGRHGRVTVGGYVHRLYTQQKEDLQGHHGSLDAMRAGRLAAAFQVSYSRRRTFSALLWIAGLGDDRSALRVDDADSRTSDAAGTDCVNSASATTSAR